MENPVQVKDINLEQIQPPYCLEIARAVVGDYMGNGARYMGAHFKSSRFNKAKFFLTGIVDESSPNLYDPKAKLMVQGGTQLGCSTRECDFCVYSNLPFYGNLEVQEIVDIFRASLFLYSKTRPMEKDERRLDLKFTDNGEPLESKNLTTAMSKLSNLFGQEKKILEFKVSSIFRDLPMVKNNFDLLCRWQNEYKDVASVHLQISRPFSGEQIMSYHEIRTVISNWNECNPKDTICISPGILKGFDEAKMMEFLKELQDLREHFFIRLAIIKPSTDNQKELLMPTEEIQRIHNEIANLSLDVRPLQSDTIYDNQLKGAGTLSHLPDGYIFDPNKYQPWEFATSKRDPNLTKVFIIHNSGNF